MLTMKWLALLLPMVMAMSIRKQNHSLVPASTPVVAVPASIMVLAEKYGVKTPTHEGEYDGIFALLDAILAKAKGSKEAIHSKHDEAKKDAEDAQQAKVDDATAKIDAYNAASDAKTAAVAAADAALAAAVASGDADVATAKSAMDTSIATREAGITSTADLLAANEDARQEALDATDSEIAVIQDVKETLGGMTAGHSYSRFAFSSCDSTGFDGPGQSACSGVWNDAHVDDVVAKWGITVEEGRQSFTAYQTGTLKIKMAGAQGGEQGYFASRSFYAWGGLPATIEATCKVTKDQVITVVVGQHGEDGNGAGGGGGSFIYHSDSQLLVAAGGGGGSTSAPDSNDHASPGQSGDSGSLGHGSNSGCRAGTSGNAGVAPTGVAGSGCAGAGWNQNAGDVTSGYCKGGKSRASGFLGGADGSYVYMGQGGFGGGGGGGNEGGGGGGYSGGAGAKHSYGGGGGGGSYVHPSCTTIARTAGEELSAANSQPAQRDGYVTVQYYVDLSEE